jgi:cell division FtsZ-interacting protein ZapD
LRLEYLLERFEQLLLRSSEIDHHFALTTLFEIVDVGGRSDGDSQGDDDAISLGTNTDDADRRLM